MPAAAGECLDQIHLPGWLQETDLPGWLQETDLSGWLQELGRSDWLGAIDPLHAITIVAMALITMITRSFFLIPERQLTLPAWALRGLHYAPIAAVVAVIVPEIIMTQGMLIDTWKDARIFGALAGLLYFLVRRGRGQVVLGTMLSGMAVFLPLRLGWGW